MECGSEKPVDILSDGLFSYALDRIKLKKLLYNSGKWVTTLAMRRSSSHFFDIFRGQLLIAIYEKDLFGYRIGEPPEIFLTVLRAFKLSNLAVIAE